MAYTTIDDPSAYFQTTLYTGDGGGTRAVTHGGNSDLNADWVWIKDRGTTSTHYIFDSVRGVQKHLSSASTSQELSDANSLKAFNSDSFTLGTSGNVNGNSRTFVSWNWKAGTSFTNDASSTGVGSIDSAGSVNDTAGFSICTYTGVSSAGTIKHGLSTVPSMIIWKNRSASNGWITYHHKNTSAPETDYLELHATNATADLNTIMNDTAPTSSVFSIGTEGAVGGSNTNNFVAYVFSERKGYSKFGSYVGNGNADGPFIYTGFKPAWFIVKRSDGVDDWVIFDSKRNGFNGENLFLKSNTAETDTSGAATYVDQLSNGFKPRNSWGSLNTSGGTYIYMAFAENPFVTSTGVPATAR